MLKKCLYLYKQSLIKSIIMRNNRLETRILKAMFSYKNIIVASAWGITAYASMYAWMYLIMFIFES